MFFFFFCFWAHILLFAYVWLKNSKFRTGTASILFLACKCLNSKSQKNMFFFLCLKLIISRLSSIRTLKRPRGTRMSLFSASSIFVLLKCFLDSKATNSILCLSFCLQQHKVYGAALHVLLFAYEHL